METYGKPVPTAVIGLGFGDEGKGMAVAHDTRKIVARGLRPVNVRFNGGPQAAHNVRVRLDGTIRHHTHSQTGSGAMLGASTVLTRGMLVSVGALFYECGHLSGTIGGNYIERVTIDSRCPVVLPTHIELNRFLEDRRGSGRHGSTGTGIGIARECEESIDGTTISVGALRDEAELARMIRFWRDGYLRQKYKLDGFSWTLEPEEEARAVAGYLAECVNLGVNVVDDADKYVRELLTDGIHGVTFEGSQGILLDERWGFPPHVTYGDMAPDGALEIADSVPVNVMGVTRTYQTRHGAGPFPTEGGVSIPEMDNVYGRWSGAFRTGLLDMLRLHLAADAAGVDEVAVSHTDRYPGRYADTGGLLQNLSIEKDGTLYSRVSVEATLDELVNQIEKECNADVTVIGHGPILEDWEDRR